MSGSIEPAKCACGDPAVYVTAGQHVECRECYERRILRETKYDVHPGLEVWETVRPARVCRKPIEIYD